MEELRQANQELHEEISRLAQSNRSIEQRVYTLERAIAICEERIRFLEEELENTIEFSNEEKEEMMKEIINLKRIVQQLEKENKQKDEKISIKDKLIMEFDECEKKLKIRIREISKSAGNTPKALNYTSKLVDENERLKREISKLQYILINRNNKIDLQKARITDLHCQNFALALLRYRDKLELINTQEALQNSQIWNSNVIISENESDENSQDSNISEEMSTIVELADTIDGYLDNPGTNREILSNQIKRVTRQIRQALIISQSIFPIPDTQKMIDKALAKQKSNYDAEIEKLRKEFQSQKAQKIQAPILQTIEPVRQSRGPPSNLKTEDYKNYYETKYFNNLSIYSNEDLDSHYPKKPFQRTNQSTRIDRIESKVDEIGQMTSQFRKM
ncbi:3247_t:CDS:2, partial [Acaulospora morrowiae]